LGLNPEALICRPSSFVVLRLSFSLPQHVQQPARALPRTFGAMRFTPDGKAVLYTSDLTGYSNRYLVEVGEFDELPDLE
jgi:hypothetical protein